MVGVLMLRHLLMLPVLPRRMLLVMLRLQWLLHLQWPEAIFASAGGGCPPSPCVIYVLQI